MPDLKKVNLAVAGLEKTFGVGCVMRLDKQVAMKVEVIPTGVLSIDSATGVGGVPRGRVTEIYGPESGGKTTLALQIIAMAQARGGLCGFIDAEHALDPKYATALGVHVKDIYCSQPDCGEQALEITEGLIRTGEFDVIVVDSVAALVPRAELDGEMGDAHMGLQARLMSQALRKLVAITAKSKTCLIFINQIREKIGVVFGNPETTTGGRALKFYSSMRIEVRRGALLKDGETIYGSQNKVKIVKNKVAAPFRECEPALIYGLGFSQQYDLLQLASDNGVVEKSGAWYAYKGERLGQGQANAVEFLKQNTAIAEQVYAATRAILFPEEKAA